MAFPQQVAEMLARHPGLTTDRFLTDKYQCQGAKHHSPNPLRVHAISLPSGMVFLCGVCRDNLQLLQGLMDAEGGALPWPVRREFGNQLRTLAINRRTSG